MDYMVGFMSESVRAQERDVVTGADVRERERSKDAADLEDRQEARAKE